jgi:hypothetical protein
MYHGITLDNLTTLCKNFLCIAVSHNSTLRGHKHLHHSEQPEYFTHVEGLGGGPKTRLFLHKAIWRPAPRGLKPLPSIDSFQPLQKLKVFLNSCFIHGIYKSKIYLFI